jgi:hypothetical protein
MTQRRVTYAIVCSFCGAVIGFLLGVLLANDERLAGGAFLAVGGAIVGPRKSDSTVINLPALWRPIVRLTRHLPFDHRTDKRTDKRTEQAPDRQCDRPRLAVHGFERHEKHDCPNTVRPENCHRQASSTLAVE